MFAVAEHGRTELELRYNDFFTAVFAMKSAVTEGDSQRHAGEETGPVTFAVGTRLGPSWDQVLRPLLDQGWLEMTIPDKPTSSKQKYRLTKKGRALLDRESDHE